MKAGKRPQPETVLAPVSYRSSRRRRQRKRLLLKVPIDPRKRRIKRKGFDGAVCIKFTLLKDRFSSFFR